jgi:hypothetical protein
MAGALSSHTRPEQFQLLPKCLKVMLRHGASTPSYREPRLSSSPFCYQSGSVLWRVAEGGRGLSQPTRSFQDMSLIESGLFRFALGLSHSPSPSYHSISLALSLFPASYNIVTRFCFPSVTRLSSSAPTFTCLLAVSRFELSFSSTYIIQPE